MSKTTALIESLYPSLSPLAPATRAEISRRAVRKTLQKGAQVFADDAPCLGFPFVLSGSIRVFKRSLEGRELPLYRVGPGESCVISTVCLMGRMGYDARAEAEDETEVAILRPDHFAELMGEASFQRFVFGLFSRRLADLMILVDALAFKRLDQRLAIVLANGPSLRRTTHQQIADELGTVREIASRILGEFEREGLLRLGRGRIEILDTARLRARGR